MSSQRKTAIALVDGEKQYDTSLTHAADAAYQRKDACMVPLTADGSAIRVFIEGGLIDAMNFVYNEIPSGAIDGANAVFTLANTPTATKQAVFLNGLAQNPNSGSDYSIAGAVITFAVAPVVGSTILVDYIK